MSDPTRALSFPPPPPIAAAPSGPTPRPVRIAVLTVSDTRTPANDTSGDLLEARLLSAGHILAHRTLIPDRVDAIRDAVDAAIDAGAEAILCTGGTGITGRDVTVEALSPRFSKTIEGFGELFRHLSYYDIGPSTMQSRAVAGLIDGACVFALPGSTGACRLAWDGILHHQLDIRSRPCNLVSLMPRIDEGPL